MEVRLFKIKSLHNNVALDNYSGTCTQLPVVGLPFTMLTREEGVLYTSPVQSYSIRFVEAVINFKTKNSEYDLKVVSQ